MASMDSMKTYLSAADITEQWIEKIAPRYFEMENINTYRSGTLGMILDILATTSEDTHHGIMLARREFYPNTAQYMKSLYRHAAARYMDIPMGTPAHASVLLMIQQSELLKFGKQEGDLHTFVLDDTFIAHVGDIPFMLDYPITILSMKRSNGKYAHTTHYDFYINNSISTSTERYLPNKILNYKAADYLIIQTPMHQIFKEYKSALIDSNASIQTITKEFKYSGMLANFEVFYKENDSSPRIQLEKRLLESGISKKPFCWYTVVDNETIRLQFPANAYFMPRLNSIISIEIFTTLGEDGNFDTYDSDIVSENASTRYPYNTQVPIFGTVDGPAIDGKNTIEKEEFRSKVVMAYCTNHTYISVHDLQLYFDQLMIGTADRFKFTPKRDDAFVRLYGAFLLMKDNEKNVIPSNTLDIDLDPLREEEDFDIYSDAVKRFIIKPGALFTYRLDIYATGRKKYVLKRMHGKHLYDDLSGYDTMKGVWHCTRCGYQYTGTEDMEEIKADKGNIYHCPNCYGSKSRFQPHRFVFTNPYLISISTDTFMAGYFLNSLIDHHDLAYTAVNDLSIVQFIARHFKVERNAIAGENYYRFSVALSPSVDIPLETVYEKRDDYIVAPYDGYVKSFIMEENAVYATIVYTWDPINKVEPPEEERIQKIQISSYISKVDETFRVCPHCGHRIPLDDWAEAYEHGFMSDDNTIMTCPGCGMTQDIDGNSVGTSLEDFEEKYIDYDYFPSYKMNMYIGERITKGDVIANARPKDLGRIRLVMDLGDIMESAVHRYIPMTIEEASEQTNKNAEYMIFAAYISTNDMIDSKYIMSIEEGYVMPDGSSGHNHSLAIPIAGLGMKLHAFYEYREDDDLEEATRNPEHAFSSYHYMTGKTFTNTYELQKGDSITLIKALDHAKGFLDALDREAEDDGIDPPDPDDFIDPDNPNPGKHPGFDPDDDHPEDEWEDDPTSDPTRNVYLRTKDHEKIMVVCNTDDRIAGYYLTVEMTEWQKAWQKANSDPDAYAEAIKNRPQRPQADTRTIADAEPVATTEFANINLYDSSVLRSTTTGKDTVTEGHPGFDPDIDHPQGEWEDDMTEDPTNTVYLRTVEHEKFLAVSDDNDRIPGYHLVVDMTEWQKKWQEKNKPTEPTYPTGPTDPLPPDPTDPDPTKPGGNKDDEYKPILPPPLLDPDNPDQYGGNFIFRLRNCPLLSANWIKVQENEKLFIDKISQHYQEIDDVRWDLENAFAIDLKFYNSYGKSRFYKIGNGPGTNLQVLDSVNITLSFGVALDFLATADVFHDRFREFVQKYIEATDDMVGNGIDIYIMNLIAAAKAEFDQIVYMEYYGLNNYDFSAQRLVIMSDKDILERVPADSFVPEFLNIIRETTTDGSKPKVTVSIIRGELDK